MPLLFGGSFAPPITEGLLHRYGMLIDTIAGNTALREAARNLHSCCATWLRQPPSTSAGLTHQSGRGTVINLDAKTADIMWDAIPWDHELNAYGEMFNAIEPSELRNACFHMLWYAWELFHDREPITTDKL